MFVSFFLLPTLQGPHGASIEWSQLNIIPLYSFERYRRSKSIYVTGEGKGEVFDVCIAFNGDACKIDSNEEVLFQTWCFHRRAERHNKSKPWCGGGMKYYMRLMSFYIFVLCLNLVLCLSATELVFFSRGDAEKLERHTQGLHMPLDQKGREKSSNMMSSCINIYMLSL